MEVFTPHKLVIEIDNEKTEEALRTIFTLGSNTMFSNTLEEVTKIPERVQLSATILASMDKTIRTRRRSIKR